MKRGLLIVSILMTFIIVFCVKFFNTDIFLDETIIIQKWDNISNIYNKLSLFDQKSLSIYLKVKDINHINLKPWIYTFTWDYSKSDFLKLLEKKETINYVNITILEWRSIYDVDYYISSKWFFNSGDYIDFTTDEKLIQKYVNKYEFLKLSKENLSDSLITLEWFLYPDTYKIDISKNFIDQLILLQLNTFKYKIWDKNKNSFLWFRTKIKKKPFNLELSFYDTITLSSIIEKEEKDNINKPTVAWIFLNRLSSWWRIDADITLCYSFYKSYEFCTPIIIWNNVSDKTNNYNTRQRSGLTPTPICNPSEATITSLLNFKSNDYYFYLHDEKGWIHYSKTNTSHNINKSKYY
jgi:UPF0755 protein